MKVFIASNYPIIRRGLRDLLSNTFTIYASETTKPASIIREIKRVSAKMLILDLAFSKEPTNNLIKQLKGNQYQLKIILLIRDNRNIYSIINSGAAGHILASEIDSELIRAIKFIARNNDCYYSPKIANMMAEALHQKNTIEGRRNLWHPPKDPTKILTKRENQIFSMQAENISISEMASKLKITTSTVYSHMTNINRKLSVT